MDRCVDGRQRRGSSAGKPATVQRAVVHGVEDDGTAGVDVPPLSRPPQIGVGRRAGDVDAPKLAVGEMNAGRRGTSRGSGRRWCGSSCAPRSPGRAPRAWRTPDDCARNVRRRAIRPKIPLWPLADECCRSCRY